MFLGEFDFDDLPIRGGSVGVTIAIAFSVSFIFFMVIVLMNVLNALAINDIPSNNDEKFLIRYQIWRINAIQKLESEKMNDIFQFLGILGFLRKIYEPPNLFVFKEQAKLQCHILMLYSKPNSCNSGNSTLHSSTKHYL